jgi:hypothetical protein
MEMRNKELFLKTLSDLRDRLSDLGHHVEGEYEYRVIRLSGLLRQLLLDGLVDQVNRPRLRLLFQINANVLERGTMLPQPSSQPSIPIYWQAGDLLDPDSAEFLLGPAGASLVKRQKMNIRQFLSTAVASWNGDKITVEALIRYTANVHGGVHPLKERLTRQGETIAPNLAMRRMRALPVKIDGCEPVLSMLPRIASVTLKGLRPLEELLAQLEV